MFFIVLITLCMVITLYMVIIIIEGSGDVDIVILYIKTG